MNRQTSLETIANNHHRTNYVRNIVERISKFSSSLPKQFDNRTLLRLAGPKSTISWPVKTCTSHLDEFVRVPPFRSYFIVKNGQPLWFLWIELCFCIFVNAWCVGAAVGATVCSFGQGDNLRETVSLIWIWRDCPEWFQLWYGRTRTLSLMKKCWLLQVQVHDEK